MSVQVSGHTPKWHLFRHCCVRHIASAPGPAQCKGRPPFLSFFLSGNCGSVIVEEITEEAALGWMPAAIGEQMGIRWLFFMQLRQGLGHLGRRKSFVALGRPPFGCSLTAPAQKNRTELGNTSLPLSTFGRTICWDSAKKRRKNKRDGIMSVQDDSLQFQKQKGSLGAR